MLRKHFEMKNKDEYGFTLIELLVVIIIIGILAAIAIPAFLNQRQRANDSAVQSDVRNVAMQIETALVQKPNATAITTPGASNAFSTGSVIVTLTDTAGTFSTDAINLTDGVSVRVAATQPGTPAQAGPPPVAAVPGAAASANGYTVEGFHSNGKQYKAAGTALKWNSAAGGFGR